MTQNIFLTILVIFSINFQLDSVAKNETAIDKNKMIENYKLTQSKLVYREILDETLKILVPDDFVLMDVEMLNLKYPKANRPTLVYTDDNGEVNIAFNYTQNKITPADIPKMKNSILNQFKQVSSINLINSELRNINNKEFFIMKFYSQAIDTKVYNLMFGTELNGRLLIGTFNCTIDKVQVWKSISEDIINSIETL